MSLWPVGILNLLGHKENYGFTSECVTALNLGLLSQGVERFSHDVTAAMLVSQTNPMGVELFSYATTFFCSNKFA